LRVLFSGHIKFEVINYLEDTPKRHAAISAVRFLPAAKQKKSVKLTPEAPPKK
jgi:hypothetical protein